MNPTLSALLLASLLLVATPVAAAGHDVPDVDTCDAATDPCWSDALACVTISSPTIRTDPACVPDV